LWLNFLKSQMKKMKKIIFFVTITLLGGCSDNQSDTSVISLDFSKSPMSIHKIGLINDVKILNLDYKKALFGDADKIIRYKDRIYLMDRVQTKSVIVYDTLGQFISLIAKHGRGPDEYLQLTDIFIDTVDFSLNIVSRNDKKIIQYDKNGERLLDVKRLEKSFTNFTKTSFGYVGYMGNYRDENDNPFLVMYFIN